MGKIANFDSALCKVYTSSFTVPEDGKCYISIGGNYNVDGGTLVNGVKAAKTNLDKTFAVLEIDVKKDWVISPYGSLYSWQATWCPYL